MILYPVIMALCRNIMILHHNIIILYRKVITLYRNIIIMYRDIIALYRYTAITSRYRVIIFRYRVITLRYIAITGRYWVITLRYTVITGRYTMITFRYIVVFYPDFDLNVTLESCRIVEGNKGRRGKKIIRQAGAPKSSGLPGSISGCNLDAHFFQQLRRISKCHPRNGYQVSDPCFQGFQCVIPFLGGVLGIAGFMDLFYF
jgi:hypothetical protein